MSERKCYNCEAGVEAVLSVVEVDEINRILCLKCKNLTSDTPQPSEQVEPIGEIYGRLNENSDRFLFRAAKNKYEEFLNVYVDDCVKVYSEKDFLQLKEERDRLRTAKNEMGVKFVEQVGENKQLQSRIEELEKANKDLRSPIIVDAKNIEPTISSMIRVNVQLTSDRDRLVEAMESALKMIKHYGHSEKCERQQSCHPEENPNEQCICIHDIGIHEISESLSSINKEKT